jgi:hypothetical protein
MNKTILFAASLLALSSCDGPWNTYPSDYTAPDPQLRVSLFAVGGRNFDTLWLERTQPLGLTYDSTRQFVQSATIQVVSADDETKIVEYSRVPGSAVAWIPEAPTKVVAGKRYRLEAHVVWNADKNWPSGTTIQTTDLVADAKVPDSWSVDSVAQVPVENLIPELAAGADVGDSATLLAPLEKRSPGILARHSFTSAMLDSLRQGAPVFRSLRSRDSIWYISDNRHEVVNPDGQTVKRAYRNILFRQRPGSDFGGVFAVERWDVTRAKILDPITKELLNSTGRQSLDREDSAALFQPGDTRYALALYPAYAPDVYGWPEIYPFSNLALAYTGPNTLYFYSVEQQYVIYHSGLSGDPATAFSNVKNGKGYFTAALVDSFSIYLNVSGTDTFSVEALRGAACRKAWKEHVQDGAGFDSLVACKGVDFRAGSR